MVFAYLNPDGDIVAVSFSFNALAHKMGNRTGLATALWVRHDTGAWNPIAAQYDRTYWTHPDSESIIVAIREVW